MYSRKFTLRQTFELSELKIGFQGQCEVHFGVPWRIAVEREEAEDGTEDHGEPLTISLICEKDADEGNPWSVSFKATFRIENGDGKVKIEDSMEDGFEGNGEIKFAKKCDWDTLMEKYVTNDKLTVEIDVVIKEMKGFVPKRKRNFDAPRKHMTDMVLIVGDRKFNISKVILSEFSDYFSSLFFNGCKETNQSEITLKEVDPDIFQMFLEIIYGDTDCISVETVEDLLVLARQYQVKVVTQRCADFMIKKVDVDLDMTFRLASAFNLQDLQVDLLEDIETIKESEDRLKTSVNHMDNDFIARMIRKVYQ